MFTNSHFPMFLVRRPPQASWRRMTKGVPRPDKIRRLRSAGRVKSAAPYSGGTAATRRKSALTSPCRFSSMARSHLLTRPSTVAPLLLRKGRGRGVLRTPFTSGESGSACGGDALAEACHGHGRRNGAATCHTQTGSALRGKLVADHAPATGNHLFRSGQSKRVDHQAQDGLSA